MSGIYSTTGRMTIVSIAFRDASNTPKNAEFARFRDSENSLKTWFSSLSVSALPENVNGYANSPTTVVVTTDAATATPNGGVAPFAYQWEDLSGLGWTITSPTLSSTTFSHAVASGDVDSSEFRCKVTDAGGTIAYTNTVYASLANLGGA